MKKLLFSLTLFLSGIIGFVGWSIAVTQFVYPSRSRTVLGCFSDLDSVILVIFVVMAITGLVLSMIEQNILLGFATSVSAIGNIGPTFPAQVGALGNFDSLTTASKGILIFNMYIGRLELIPFLVMLQKDFWTFKKC